ncbi:MAG: hypothetical protein AAGA99_00210 [Actinomycetota bacterium]
MLARLRSRSRSGEDRGTTLVEVIVASTIGALALAATYTVFWGFTDDVAVATDLASAQRETRPVISAMVIELRQATPPNAAAGGNPVVALSTTSASFVTDRWDATGPELVTYQLESCSAGLCDLRQTVIAADTTAVEPEWTHDDATLVLDRIVARDVVDPASSGDALFAGVNYVAGAAVETASCDVSTGTACDFALVAVDLKIDPNGLRDNPRVYEVYEEVRMRNAQ